MVQRTTTGSSSSYEQNVNVNGSWNWLKLVRSGNVFAAYVSRDALNWSQAAAPQTIAMAPTVYIGLEVSSGDNSNLTTGTFDSVSISTPANNAPVITNVSGTTGSIGSQIAIAGSGFGNSQNGSVVLLNGAPVSINSWSATSIIFTIPSGATSGPLLVSVAPSMNDSNAINFTVTSQPLPSPWLDSDVGVEPKGLAGSATYASGSFTVKGSGSGTFGNSDQFHFVYQNLVGNGTIVARLVSVPSNANAGITIRETLSPTATNAQSYYANTAMWMGERTATGGNAAYQVGPSQLTLPYWMKVVRSGSTFNGYASSDGVNWVQIGTSQTINMAQNAYVGFEVYSNDNSTLATATFDSVSLSNPPATAPVITGVSATTGSIGSQVVISGTGFGASQNGSAVTLSDAAVTVNSWSSTSITITIPVGATSGPLLVSVAPNMDDSNAVNFAVTSQPLPTSWLDQDVGAVGPAGSATYSAGTFTLNGAGGGTWGTSDQFHFVYQPLPGDGTIIARIATAQNGTYPTAGVMIRESLDPAATNAQVIFGAGNNIFYMLERASTGGSTSYQGYAAGLPNWVKLIRSGNLFNGYESSDGINWNQVGSTQTINMAQNVYVGLITYSYDNQHLSVGTFNNVSLTIGNTPFVSALTPVIGPVGTQVTITGSSFGASQGSSTVSFNGMNATAISSWTNNQIVATVPAGAPGGVGPVNVTVNSVASLTDVSFDVINPSITSLSPPSAPQGSTVVLNGIGFGASQGTSQVSFNGIVASASYWSDTSVYVQVPSNATNGPVTLTEDGITSNGVQFNLLEAVSVSSISPTVGAIGTTVTITGSGFGNTQSNSTVTFYDIPATAITSWTDTTIQVVVPPDADTGPVSVQVAGQVSLGPTFSVTNGIELQDSKSNISTYTSMLVGGRWVPYMIQGSGCSSCTERGTITYSYDNKGNRLSRTDENGNKTTYTYDGFNNPLTITVPISSVQSATTTYTYNGFGEVLTMTDPLGNVTTNTYDANGNLLSVTTPAPGNGASASVTQFAYNALGELTKITDPLNNSTTLTYTPAGLISTITDAQQNVTTYGYDSLGNRTSVTDANNKQTTFTYDAMNRLTKITYPDTTTTQFGYDTRGRRTSVTDQNSKQTTYSYDDADRLITVTDAANNVTTYGYDTENNLTSIQDANHNTTSFNYDAFGRVTTTQFPSGAIEQYSYDNVGNLTSKTDRKNQQITYTYDQLNRLIQKAYPDTTAVNYTYDLSVPGPAERTQSAWLAGAAGERRSRAAHSRREWV